MSQGNQNRGNGGSDRRFISRDEFEVFEKNVDSAFARLSEAVSELSNKMDRASTTNWPVLTGFGSLIIAIIALAGAPFMRDLSRLDRGLDALADKVLSIQSNRWSRADHESFERATADAIAAVKDHADESRVHLDETLQREMRLLDDALQREMRMLLDEPVARLRAVEAEIVRRQAVLDDLRSRSEANAITIAERSRVVEKVDALERSVREISAEQRRRTGKVYDSE